MCLNETYRRVRIGNDLSDKFTTENGLKQRDALPPLLFNFAFKYAIRSNAKTSVRIAGFWGEI
jgi:hypothetical protein